MCKQCGSHIDSILDFDNYSFCSLACIDDYKTHHRSETQQEIAKIQRKIEALHLQKEWLSKDLLHFS